MRMLPAGFTAARAMAGLALLALTGGALAQSTAGTVEFSVGQASIRASSGLERPAARGAAIVPGDTVETQSGRVQLRMIDGAFISLQPQTSLQVQSYSLATAGVEERGFLSLLRGGLRTVTGLIGRQKRDSYRLGTTAGTLGIRGTEFAVTTGEGTRVNVTEGIVALCTEAGCVDIGAGQSGFAPDNKTRPGLAFVPARLPPLAAPLAVPFMVAEVRDSSGTSLVAAEAIRSGAETPQTPPQVPATIPIGNGPGGFSVASVKLPGGSFSAGLLGSTLTSNGAGLVTQAIDCCVPSNSFGSGVSTDFGADGIIAWGRWSSGTRGGGPLLTANYVAALSISGVSSGTTPSIVRAYASFASTAPIITSGDVIVATGAPNSVSGTLNVNFPNWSSGGGTLSYSLSIPVAGQTFSINGNAVQLGTGTSFLGTSSTITSTGLGCASGCSGNIPFGNALQGFITGPTATRAGANYGFTSNLGQVTGAVVFQ